MSAPETASGVLDRTDRRKAQSEFGKPIVVVAGAGTGKTALLVARIAVWCVGPGWERHSERDIDPQTVARRVIERVVAITFTEAAAAEMAHRIGAAFLDLADGREPIGWDPKPGVLPGDPEVIRERAQALSEENHRLVVATIHAFCQRLLATYPLEAGLHPRFEVDADGVGIETLAADAVEEALRGLEGLPQRGHWQRLAREGVGPAKIVEALCQLVEEGVSPELFDEDPFGEVAVATTINRLRLSLERFWSVVGSRLDSVKGSTSVATRDDLTELAERVGAVGPSPTLSDLEDLAEAVGDKAVPRLKKWSRHDLTGSEGECLGEILSDAAVASGELAALLTALTGLCREELGAARGVVGPLMTALENRRNAAGLVTFSDLLRRTVKLLSGSRGVWREVVAGIDHLLVDEFQDTDDVQCRLVELLALTGEAADRPSLFVVGDPKQSIYAWRNADLAAYDHFVAGVVRTGGETVDLVRNFRSVTPILEEVERLVAPVMRHEPGIQPPFQRLEATDERRGVPGVDRLPWRTVEHWLIQPRGEDGAVAETGEPERAGSNVEAEALAADIRRLHDEGVIESWGEVAILLRVTTAQEELLQAFREAGVPYEVARERDYYRQREVVELAALVRCVLEPTDVLALLTVLRSDVVGAPDVALAPLWEAGYPAAMARLSASDPATGAAVAEAITRAHSAAPAGPADPDLLGKWPSSVQSAVDIIAELRRSIQSDPADIFVEKIRTLWLAEVTAAARHLGGFRRARVDRFLSDLEATLIQEQAGDAEVARFLRRAVEEGGESRVPLPPDLETDAVHVMTIHKAKGLDFKHVYVAQIHRGGRGGGNRKTAAVGRFNGRREYRLFGWATPGFAAAEWVQERKTRAEMVRLLYVATTRAKNRLVISGEWGRAGEEVAPEAASSFGKLLGRRLDPQSVSEQIVSGGDRSDGDSTDLVQVIPIFAADKSADDAAPRRDPEWSMPDDRLELAATLATARLAAEERMQQPVFRSASAEAHRRLQQAEADETEPVSEGGVDRELAMALGTAVHEMMEALDLEQALGPQVEERRAAILADLGSGESIEWANELLARLVMGWCLRQLGALGPHVVARELPVMVWAEDDGGPGAVVSGFIDLVYRDPDDGRVVVADYKTDAVDGEAAVAERVRVYEPQVRTYASALRQALDLDYDPHVELWFLAADRIERVE